MNGIKRETPTPAFIPCGDSFEKMDAMGVDVLEKASQEEENDVKEK